MQLPTVLAHTDWSVNPEKRWLAQATRQPSGRYLAQTPTLTGPASTLISRLFRAAGPDGIAVLGVDFPIGLPGAYAEKAEIADFISMLSQFGTGLWSDFYTVAETADEISLYRPFYPQRPGNTAQQHLLDGLQLMHMNQLRRRCDLPRPGRRAAAPLFWTLGGQQVGKAAIDGWQSVLAPALCTTAFEVAVWPFHGPLIELFQPNRVIIAETYPAECYDHLGVSFPRSAGQPTGKRVQTSRAENASALLKWADDAQVDLTPDLRDCILDGFGASNHGEDAFDATVGLFGLLNVVLGHRACGAPADALVRNIEGWILGQVYV